MLSDIDYPPRLKQIHDPPDPLFVRGTLPDPNRIHLAVVGTRTPTRYSHEVVEKLVGPIAARGVVIVSGLAYGVDGLAHRAALEAKGTTLAVLGGSLVDETAIPPMHRGLASRIVAEGGAVMSEFPADTAMAKWNFPKRNRVIAGLCQAVLIVEAAEKSGSLITARSALDEGRDVFAVPGPITSPLSEGPNRLIKTGATPITCVDDLFEALGLIGGEAKAKPVVELTDPDERAVYAVFGVDPLHVDEVIRVSKLPAIRVNVALTALELKGAITHAGGRHFGRS